MPLRMHAFCRAIQSTLPFRWGQAIYRGEDASCRVFTVQADPLRVPPITACRGLWCPPSSTSRSSPTKAEELHAFNPSGDLELKMG